VGCSVAAQPAGVFLYIVGVEQGWLAADKHDYLTRRADAAGITGTDWIMIDRIECRAGDPGRWPRRFGGRWIFQASSWPSSGRPRVANHCELDHSRSKQRAAFRSCP
jgi:hypothetical protein